MERRLLLGYEALAVPSTAPYCVRFPMSEGKLNVTPSYPLHSVLDDISDLWHYLALKAAGQRDSAEYSVGPTHEQLKDAAEDSGIPRDSVWGLSGRKGGDGGPGGDGAGGSGDDQAPSSAAGNSSANGLNGVKGAAKGLEGAVGAGVQLQSKLEQGSGTEGGGVGVPEVRRRFPKLSSFSGVLVVPATLSSREVRSWKRIHSCTLYTVVCNSTVWHSLRRYSPFQEYWWCLPRSRAARCVLGACPHCTLQNCTVCTSTVRHSMRLYCPFQEYWWYLPGELAVVHQDAVLSCP